MLQLNKDELSKRNNLIVEANDKIERAKAEIERYTKLLQEASAWIDSHMATIYPTGGQVYLPRENGKGAIVIVRRLSEDPDNDRDYYVTERLVCD